MPPIRKSISSEDGRSSFLDKTARVAEIGAGTLLGAQALVSLMDRFKKKGRKFFSSRETLDGIIHFDDVAPSEAARRLRNSFVGSVLGTAGGAGAGVLAALAAKRGLAGKRAAKWVHDLKIHIPMTGIHVGSTVGAGVSGSAIGSKVGGLIGLLKPKPDDRRMSARDQLDRIINFSAAHLGNTHPLDQHSGSVAEILFGSDPRPRNQLGMFTDGEEGGPNPNTIWQTYKQPAMAGAVGGTAAAAGGTGLRALMDKLKNRKVKLGAREELDAICFARKGGDYKRHWSQKKIGKKQDPKSKKEKKKHYDGMNDMSAREQLNSIISFGYRYEDTEESDLPGLAPTSGAIAGGVAAGVIPTLASRQAARDLPAMKANAALGNGKVFTTPGYAATRAQNRYNVMTGGRGMDRIPAAKEAARGMMTDLGKTRIGSAAKSLNYRATSRLGRIGMLGKLGLAGAGALAGG